MSRQNSMSYLGQGRVKRQSLAKRPRWRSPRTGKGGAVGTQSERVQELNESPQPAHASE